MINLPNNSPVLTGLSISEHANIVSNGSAPFTYASGLSADEHT